ncbi:MAG: putative manganese-dependent inorganic diphosphatase [Bilifractor sp.]|jgi:manganese-dependent inorganic pyrophosphatase
MTNSEPIAEGKEKTAGQDTKTGNKVHRRTVYVVGHKNPDTDSICSAISYAYLKNILDPDRNYKPCRAGHIAPETRYVLDTFGFESPILLTNIGTRVKDMEIRQVPGVTGDISVRKAWRLMRSENVFTLPITDEEDRLHGLITVNDIAKSYMDETDSAIVSRANTPYRNILETLNARMVVGDEDSCFTKGKVIIAAANPDVMEQYIDENDMVILGNRYEAQLCAIEMLAGCIVICLGTPASKTIRLIAKEHNCTVIETPLDTYEVARRINQSMPISFFMKRDNLVTFHRSDYTDDIKDIMSSRRFRDFPILDQEDRYTGMISRRNLLGVHKRGVILVDHNEVEQAVDNVMAADILEIIDHHKLGSIETMNPVYFRNEPVGCTGTIVWQIYRENQVEIPKNIAGLLCSAILSDTLMFRSPTCTPLDRTAAEELAGIAGIRCEDHARKMFSAGSELGNKTPEEICFQDFKKFEANEIEFGIGQVNSLDQEELDEAEKRVAPYLETACRSRGLDILIFMLTNILTESSKILCCGENADELVEDAFPGVHVENHTAILPKVVSRKKQMVPSIMEAISRGSNEG